MGALALNRLTESSGAREFRQALDEIYYKGPDAHEFSTLVLRRHPLPIWMLKIVVLIFGSIIPILTWPYWLFMKVREKILDDQEEKVFAVNVTDLIKRMSVEEIEETERVNDPMGAVPDIAFGFLHPVWEKFKAGFKSGDEIWTYKATWKNDWQNQNRFGYAILRGKAVVYQLMTSWEDVEDSSDPN